MHQQRMMRDETDISAQQKETGKNAWFFEKNVNQAGKKGDQQTQG
jgi:hypothetical protein